jgi:hypothetical protein
MLQEPKTTQKTKIFTCEICHYVCSHISNYNKHKMTKKHKIKIEEKNCEIESKTISKSIQDPKIIETLQNYKCDYCNFFTKKPSVFNKHINTIKHKEKINPINENTIKYNCKHCEKEYNKKNSCTKHEKICILQNPIIEHPRELLYSDIINRLIQENKELRNFMTEQTQAMTEQTQAMTEQTQSMSEQNQVIIEQNKEFIKTITDLAKNNHTINNTLNTNNNKFNINLFLNEKCKDAMNFADFIKNIEVSHEDLENNAELGFVNGISKIIVDNLKQLSIYDRPIHCSDVKRETMYIKDENKWEKEEDTKKLKNAIQEVSRKSMVSLVEWQDTNPDFQDMDSEFSNKCISMTQQCIAGSNRDVYYPKVIKSLAKETMIEKNM